MKRSLKVLLTALFILPAMIIVAGCKPKTVSISNANITISQTSYVYDGTQKLPSVLVVHKNKTLTLNKDYGLTYENNISVGTATVKVSGKGGYKGTVSKNFEITPLTLSGISAEDIVKTYAPNTHHSIEVKGTIETDVVKYRLAGQTQYVLENPKLSNAGEHVVEYVVERANHTQFFGQAKIIINKANIEGVSIENINAVYNGTVHKFTITGTLPTDIVMFLVSETEGYKSDVSFTTPVTHNEIPYKVQRENYNDLTGTVNVFIDSAKQQNITVKNTQQVYNGQNAMFIVEGFAEGSVVKYSLNENGPFVETLQDTKNVGTYTIYYSIEKLHHETYKGHADLTITKATIENVDLNNVVKFNGTEHSIKEYVSEISTDQFTVLYSETQNGAYSQTKITKTNAGEYTIYFKLENSNYNTYEGFATLTITKAKPTITTAPTATKITYGENLANSELTNGEASVEGSFVWNEPQFLPDATDEFGEEWDVNFLPTDGQNYEPVVLKVAVEVSKRNPNARITIEDETILAGLDLRYYTITKNSDVSGTFEYDERETIKEGNNTISFTFTPTDSENYNSLEASYEFEASSLQYSSMSVKTKYDGKLIAYSEYLSNIEKIVLSYVNSNYENTIYEITNLELLNLNYGEHNIIVIPGNNVLIGVSNNIRADHVFSKEKMIATNFDINEHEIKYNGNTLYSPEFEIDTQAFEIDTIIPGNIEVTSSEIIPHMLIAIVYIRYNVEDEEYYVNVYNNTKVVEIKLTEPKYITRLAINNEEMNFEDGHLVFKYDYEVIIIRTTFDTEKYKVAVSIYGELEFFESERDLEYNISNYGTYLTIKVYDKVPEEINYGTPYLKEYTINLYEQDFVEKIYVETLDGHKLSARRENDGDKTIYAIELNGPIKGIFVNVQDGYSYELSYNGKPEFNFKEMFSKKYEFNLTIFNSKLEVVKEIELLVTIVLNENGDFAIEENLEITFTNNNTTIMYNVYGNFSIYDNKFNVHFLNINKTFELVDENFEKVEKDHILNEGLNEFYIKSIFTDGQDTYVIMTKLEVINTNIVITDYIEQDISFEPGDNSHSFSYIGYFTNLGNPIPVSYSIDDVNQYLKVRLTQLSIDQGITYDTATVDESKNIIWIKIYDSNQVLIGKTMVKVNFHGKINSDTKVLYSLTKLNDYIKDMELTDGTIIFVKIGDSVTFRPNNEHAKITTISTDMKMRSETEVEFTETGVFKIIIKITATDRINSKELEIHFNVEPEPKLATFTFANNDKLELSVNVLDFTFGDFKLYKDMSDEDMSLYIEKVVAKEKLNNYLVNGKVQVKFNIHFAGAELYANDQVFDNDVIELELIETGDYSYIEFVYYMSNDKYQPSIKGRIVFAEPIEILKISNKTQNASPTVKTILKNFQTIEGDIEQVNHIQWTYIVINFTGLTDFDVENPQEKITFRIEFLKEGYHLYNMEGNKIELSPNNEIEVEIDGEAPFDGSDYAGVFVLTKLTPEEIGDGEPDQDQFHFIVLLV